MGDRLSEADPAKNFLDFYHLVKEAQDHEAPITPFLEMPRAVSVLVKQDTGAAITTLPPDPISQGIGGKAGLEASGQALDDQCTLGAGQEHRQKGEDLRAGPLSPSNPLPTQP